MNETIHENPNFRLKAVAELLDGEHHFYIPSYQRGYRWNKKQVEDLLKDIWDFAKNDENKRSDFYCLQPVVVKQKKSNIKMPWIVIDGQQRLTTLLLLLNYLKEGSRTPFVKNSAIYNITYETRTEMDFSNPKKDHDIDSFHVAMAKSIIEQWFIDRIDEIDYSAMEKVLFNKSKDVAQVKVIWYVDESETENETENDIESIKTFNNLNKGKIGLTNAELIKALFILKAQEAKNGEKVEELNINELSYEWNEIENTLQDNRFWYFLANKDYNPATRIDIIFDFLTRKGDKDDSDFAYRKFQSLFDRTDTDFWVNEEVTNFTEAWKKVKEVFQSFLYWYEDSTLYHYVGYLICNNISISEIYKECGNLSKSEVVVKLQNLIGLKVLNFNRGEIDDFSYSDNSDKEKLFKILLFYNIETAIKQQQNQNKIVNNINNTTYYKFPFDLFKLNDWDIEHVGSHKDNPLDKVKDKIVWLGYIENIFHNANEWPDLKVQARLLKKELEEKNEDRGGLFKELYGKIYLVIQDSEKAEKDTINNLTLLDAGTNRGYGNALFPTKREIIISNDTKGIFIPPCTRNLFLKYYSNKDTENSQWKNTWTESDGKSYREAIHQTIDFILKK